MIQDNISECNIIATKISQLLMQDGEITSYVLNGEFTISRNQKTYKVKVEIQ